MTKILASYKISVCCDTENLDIIREFVEKIAKRYFKEEDTLSEIELAVDEACTNSMKHACHYDSEKQITVQIKIKENEFIIDVIDRGENSFDPTHVEEVDLKEFIKERRKGGLGIHLIRNLMDDVTYYSGPKNYNRVSLSKKINKTKN